MSVSVSVDFREPHITNWCFCSLAHSLYLHSTPVPGLYLAPEGNPRMCDDTPLVTGADEPAEVVDADVEPEHAVAPEDDDDDDDDDVVVDCLPGPPVAAFAYVFVFLNSSSSSISFAKVSAGGNRGFLARSTSSSAGFGPDSRT